MRRVALLLMLLITAALNVTRQSQAASVPAYSTTPGVTTINGHCFLVPSYALVPCPGTATPGATSAVLPPPNKSVGLSGGGAPVVGVTDYTVTLTAKLLCFSLSEPILVYLLGSPGAAVLTPISPAAIESAGTMVKVLVDPTTGTATLRLEVLNAAVRREGLVLKAVWPEENLEKLVTVVAPSGPVVPPPPTSTPTVGPGATPTSTMTVTGATGAAASLPSPTPQPLSVRACVTPNPMVGVTTASLYGLTLPGASCAPSVVYNNGLTPSSLKATGQVAGPNGFVTWTWTENTTSNGGTATVSCTLNGQTVRASVTFTVTHP